MTWKAPYRFTMLAHCHDIEVRYPVAYFRTTSTVIWSLSHRDPDFLTLVLTRGTPHSISVRE